MHTIMNDVGDFCPKLDMRADISSMISTQFSSAHLGENVRRQTKGIEGWITIEELHFRVKQVDRKVLAFEGLYVPIFR